MELNRLLLKKEQCVDDIYSTNNAVNNRSMASRRRFPLSKMSHPPLWTHLILLASYTVLYIWVVKTRRKEGDVPKEMIYCIATFESRHLKRILLTIFLSQLQLERRCNMRGESFSLSWMEIHLRDPQGQNLMPRGIVC